MRGGTIDLPDAATTAAIGAALAEAVRPGDVIALAGPLGAGKTSLVRGLLAGLGFPGDVPSPSYPIVITYDPPDVRLPVWHVDLYRIDDRAALTELGLAETNPDAVLAVEWPERMGSALSPDALHVAIAPAGAGRCLTWRAPAAWDDRWPPSR